MGWIEDYVQSASARSPAAPLIYHEVSALFVLSTIVGPKVYMHLASGKVYSTIWPMLLGDSGTTKKSTCMDMAADILQEVMPENQIVESFNVEGLVDELNEHAENGVAHVFAVQDEFGRLLSDMRTKDYMKSLKDVMMKLYDGKPPGRRTRKVNARFKEVYFTFLAGTTEKRLFELLDRSDVEDGFWPRLFPVRGVGNGYKSQPEMTPNMIMARQRLISDIKLLKKYLDLSPGVRMKFDDDAKAYWDNWCADLDQKVHRGELVGSISARMTQNFVKLCMLREVSDNVSQAGLLGSPWPIGLDCAVQVAERLEPVIESANDLYYRLGRHRGVDAVLTAIGKAGPEGISHTRLLRQIGCTHRTFKVYITTLLESETIEMAEIETKTKPKIVYRISDLQLSRRK